MNDAKEISNCLAAFPLAKSSDAVDMEDLIVIALFASRRPHLENSHIPRTHGEVFNHTGEMLHVLGDLFSKGKIGFDIRDSGKHLSSAIDLVDLLSTQACFRHLNNSKLTVLRWCIAAYAMLLDPASRVKLSVDRSLQTGFGLTAKTNLLAEEEIWEAIGSMPGDNKTISALSAITAATGQNQRKGSSRTLYGPLRMINHRCILFNAKFMSIRGTSSFVLYATRDIAAGEEITIDYGPNWFEGACPCIDCQETPGIEVNKELSQSTYPSSTPHPSLLSALYARRMFIEAEAQERVKGALKRNAEKSLEAEGEGEGENRARKRRKRCRNQADSSANLQA